MTYAYTPARGGFEITNGPSIYNRPLYGPHCRDRDNFDERLLAVVGDVPDALLLLINWRIPGGGGCAAAKLGHFFLGVRDGKWFHDFERITARYVPGHQEYELEDPSIPGTVGVTYVRPVDFEGLLARVRIPEGCVLVFAFGGPTGYEGGRHYDYQEGRGSPKDFHPEDCAGSQIGAAGQAFSVRQVQAGHDRTCRGTASQPLALSIRDGGSLAGGCREFMESGPTGFPMAAGTCVTGAGDAVYFLLTTDDLDREEIRAYQKHPGAVFEACCHHYRELSGSLRIETPDPFLDLGLEAQILGQDGAWHDPCFTHGPWSWATPHAGWRICYGATVLGWHDRVQSSTAEFFPGQAQVPERPCPSWHRPDGYSAGHVSRGAVPDTARTSHFFYNMGEVLVDHILYDWEWTGDLAFMERAFDFIADKLLWEERLLDADGDGLYENWLNTWVSDAHWYNGGGCIQASVYNWRANAIMADVASRLGRDAAVFRSRAERIRSACERVLWVAQAGVYAEYRDAVGRKLLHPSPELASIYLPIDFRFCDDFRAYQMLRFTEHAIANEIGTTPRGGRLVWSSNWLPALYSSLGLYPQETIHLMLCYYRLGLAEKADALLKGLEASFFMGPCPGGIAHNQRVDGSHFGSTDFTDTTSLFIRTVVEGLFGVQMDVPNARVTVQPCFPTAWDRASIRAADIACEYSWDGRQERLCVRTLRTLEYRVRLRARTARIRSVRVNGSATPYRVEPGIATCWLAIEVPAGNAAQVTVSYGEAGMPRLEGDGIAAQGERYRLAVVDGAVDEIYDPQGVAQDVDLAGRGASLRITGPPGWHTFFVHATSGEVNLWLPVDVEVRPPLQIVDPRLRVDGFRVRGACRLANNTQREIGLSGVLRLGGSKCFVERRLAALQESPEIEFGASEPGRLTPGSNRLLAQLDGDLPCTLWADAVAWHLSGAVPQVAAALGRARRVDLSPFAGQELLQLHEQSYLEPRPGTYSIMVKENGRSQWDWNAKGFGKAEPRIDRLLTGDGVFVSDMGVAFAVPHRGEKAVVVSMWDNHPSRIVMPVNARARKLYFLLIASTNPMQSRLENARLTVRLSGDRQSVLSLVNPDNLDDWLCTPFAQSGFVQPIGEDTHALILDRDLGDEEQVLSVELECLCNEVIVALAGLTVL